MDGLRDVVRHVERNIVGDAVGEALADLGHSLLDIVGHLHSVGAGQHQHVDHGRVGPVDIPHSEDGAVVARAHYDVLELVLARKPSSRGDGRGHVHVLDRLLAEHARRRLAVLVPDRALEVADREAEARELVGLQPDLHRVVAAADALYAAHSGHAAYHVHHVERGVVAEVDLVELGVGRLEGDGEQAVGGLLLDGDTVLDHLGGQSGLGLLDPVLNLDGRQVGVGRAVEGHGGGEGAGVGVGRLHVEHSGSSVELLLDGGRHGLGDGHRARARIGGGYPDLRRHHVGILVDRQHRQADDADDDYEHRYDRREDRPVYEEIRFHTLRAFIPWISLCWPSTTISSPASSPLSTMVLLPFSGPTSMKRFSTVPFGRKTKM